MYGGTTQGIKFLHSLHGRCGRPEDRPLGL